MPDYICRGREQLQAVASLIACQLSPNKIWRISIAEYRARRSNDQNNLAWRLYRAIADETGHNAEEIHVICKHKFGEPVTYKMGDLQVTEYRTRDKDVGWMSDYIDRVSAWAATEFGVCVG